MGMAGASLVPATALLMTEGKARASQFRRGLTQGDVDILSFLAAAEILETDLWTQYTEFAQGNPAYGNALKNLDAGMVQYLADQTDDSDSHQSFHNKFLALVGAPQVNLEAFRVLPGSTATGSSGKLRLTNLMHLNVDTSWYTRYRSTENPDFGDTFLQAVENIKNLPSIPVSDADTPPNTDLTIPFKTDAAKHIQAIANTAAFHFATIEQGGSSLYGSFIPKATSLVVLRILYYIGGSEVNHFAIWHDKARNAVSDPLAPLIDPKTGLKFRNLNVDPGGELFQTNLIMPEPCDFIANDETQPALPTCSIIRPTLTKDAGAVAAATFLTNMGLFTGQSKEFFSAAMTLAKNADRARRQLEEADREGEV
jgi:hypothetical protein